MNALTRDFFLRESPLVAKDLLGKILLHHSPHGEISGRIVEVEAYLADKDPAAHSYKGKTKRNQSLFKAGGHAYIFSIHGHFCMDISTNSAKIPTSVLLRALEPLSGIEIMQQNRGQQDLKNLTNGPGKLTKALGITKEFDGLDLTLNNSPLQVVNDDFKVGKIISSTRIGISKAKEFKHRYYLANSAFVSK